MQKMHIGILVLFFAILLAGNTAYSQNSDTLSVTTSDPVALQQSGLQAYRNADYSLAIEILEPLDTPVAALFLAKSYYGMGDFNETIRIASALSTKPPVAVAREAQFTRALAHYQLKEFAEALDLLFFLSNQSDNPELSAFSSDFLQATIDYLSFDQRLNTLRRSRTPEIRELLVKEYLRRYNRARAFQLIDVLESRNGIEYSDLRREADSIVDYEMPDVSFGRIPPGTTWRIGVLLPGFQEEESDRGVSKGLYGGLLLAADQFNRNSPDIKVEILFKDTEAYGDNIGDALTDLTRTHRADLIVGPLFSEQVSRIAGLANNREIPVFAPLANTIELSEENRFVFQMNPSFNARGEQYARFAVEDFGRRRIGVITESGSVGESEAIAFKAEAERLGAEVPLFFAENFAATGYSVSHILPWFANDTTLIDTTRYVADSLDAVFLSFTGDVAEILLDLTLTGLEAFRPDYMVIGNEVMTYLEHSLSRVRRLELIYADTYSVSEGAEETINFSVDYQNRMGTEPNMFAHLGFDLGQYLISALRTVHNPGNLVEFMPFLGPFDGLATSVFFGEHQMNQSLQFFRLTTEGPRRITEAPCLDPESPLFERYCLFDDEEDDESEFDEPENGLIIGNEENG